MSSSKKHPKSVARLQNGLPIWLNEDHPRLSLQQVATRAGCSERRIRQLIELGLIDGARKVGSKTSYSLSHVLKVQAVQRVLDEGRYSLRDLAWLTDPDSILALNLVDEVAPRDFLLALCESDGDRLIGKDRALRPIKSPTFEKRALAAIASAMKSVVKAERERISAAKGALAAAMRLGE